MLKVVIADMPNIKNGDIDSRYQDTAELYAGDVNLATADASTKQCDIDYSIKVTP